MCGYHFTHTFCCTRAHTHTHTRTHVHTHTRAHTHTHTHTHTCTHADTLTSQIQPTPAQIAFRKGLVTLGRFPYATLRLPHRQSDWLWSHAFELISILKVISTGGGWVRLARLTLLYCQWNILILLISWFLTRPKFLGVLIVLVTNIPRTCLCSYLYFIRCPAAEYALQKPDGN